MNIFYAPDIAVAHFLPEEESSHCIRVLRMRAGCEVTIADGKGSFFKAVIVDANPKKCSVNILERRRDEPKDFYVHIAIAPTKSIDRFEFFLEKATEIGIDEITPLLCEHSERKAVKRERLEKVLVSSMKQSLRSALPRLNEMTSFQELIVKKYSGKKFIAHLSPDSARLKDICKKNENAFVLIGPEGDFSQKELNLALKNGFGPVRLGPSRLRTETAGIVACEIINMINE